MKCPRLNLYPKSFNYASSNDGKDEGHNLLDIVPPKQHDTDLRKRLEYDTHSDNKGDDYSEKYKKNDYHKKISNILP